MERVVLAELDHEDAAVMLWAQPLLVATLRVARTTILGQRCSNLLNPALGVAHRLHDCLVDQGTARLHLFFLRLKGLAFDNGDDSVKHALLQL